MPDIPSETPDEALRKSEARFRNLFEHAPDGIVIADQDGRIVMVNARAEVMFGYSREELTGQEIEVLIPESYREIHYQHRARYLHSPTVRPMGIGYELIGMRKGGDAFQVEISLSPLEMEDGVLVTSILRDISERKRVERELNAMVEFARLNPSPVIRLDNRGKIVLANPAARTYFQREDLVGQSWDAVCPGADWVELDQLFVASGMFLQEMALNGRVLSLLYHSTLETGFVHIFGFDITKQKEAEKTLQAMNEILELRVRERTLELQNSLDRLERIFGSTIYAMAKVVEIRDVYTAGHQARVAQLSREIAQTMGLPKDQVNGTYMAGLIHDIGKIYVPAEILTRPGQLSEVEFNLVKEHPRVGAEILQQVEFPWPVAQIILQHHERLDGSGYPNGLQGEEILLEAKILAVADTVEAMSSHRPYRPAMGIEVALELIQREAGRLFDVEIVAVCVKLFREVGFQFEA